MLTSVSLLAGEMNVKTDDVSRGISGEFFHADYSDHRPSRRVTHIEQENIPASTEKLYSFLLLLPSMNLNF